MSKSALYVANTSNQTVQVDGIITPGTIVRRYGPNIGLAGNAIQIAGAGYYEINASLTAEATAAGEITVTVYKDGVPLQGATATETAAAVGDFVNLSISAIVREFCSCCDGLTNLTFVLTENDATITNVAITVEKL
jgi:hypothetical protein